jgi:hypothetical protein
MEMLCWFKNQGFEFVWFSTEVTGRLDKWIRQKLKSKELKDGTDLINLLSPQL